MVKHESHVMDQMSINSEASQRATDCNLVNNDLGKNLPVAKILVQPLGKCPNISAGSTGSTSEVDTDRKETKRSETIEEEENMEKLLTLELNKIGMLSMERPAEGNFNGKGSRIENVNMEANSIYEIQSKDCTSGISSLRLTDEQGPDGKLAENNRADRESESLIEESYFSVSASSKVDVLNSSKAEETIEQSHVVEVSTDTDSSGICEDISVPLLDPMKVKEKVLPLEVKQQLAAEIEVHNKIVVGEGKCSDEDRNVSKNYDIQVTFACLSLQDLEEAECFLNILGPNPRVAPDVPARRKLLVLDINGLLADIVMPAPKDRKSDIRILGRAIFKRPFYDDFLKFCFENYDVAIWSSRSKKIVDRIVDYLFRDLKEKLLFCWDMIQSSQTGFKTLENIHKPLVFKELKKIWENNDPNLSWKKGDYDESNTLLLDDSPYKALLNPPHTAIFPNSYHYLDKDDNSLGPGGDLRVYLEGLLASDNVQNYVKDHPFGQSAINETSTSWEFYSGVLQAMSN